MPFAGEHYELVLTFNLFQNYLLFQEESTLQYILSESWCLLRLSSVPEEKQTLYSYEL